MWGIVYDDYFKGYGNQYRVVGGSENIFKKDDTPEEEHAIVLNTIYVPCHIILVRGNIENDPTQNSHTKVSLCSKIW